jgi:WD40 repeat protein
MSGQSRQSPLRVFISHTSEFREWPPDYSFVSAVEAAVTRTGNAITDMQYFTARSVGVSELCRAQISNADVYVGIIGFRGGSFAEESLELSYTELEFNTAGEMSIPRLVFLLAEDALVPIATFIDLNSAFTQSRFRERLKRSGVVVTYFRTVGQLESLVTQALYELTESLSRDRASTSAPNKSAIWMAPPRIEDIIVRQSLMQSIVNELRRERTSDSRKSRVLLLEGPAGFGKTTLAAEVVRELHRLEAFPDGMLWVTVGRDINASQLLTKVNELATCISGESVCFSDLEFAGSYLGSVFGEAGFLIVIDDVWRLRDLEPFLRGGHHCARLVTTRVRRLIPSFPSIVVDAMTSQESTALLSRGIDNFPDEENFSNRLLALSCGWPLLLALINSAVRRYVRRGVSAIEAVERVESALNARGPAALDREGGVGRTATVRATIDGSLEMLAQREPRWLERYIELAIFPGDLDLPLHVLERYWADFLAVDEAEQLCAELADLSLVQGFWMNPPHVRMHSVVLSYLRHRAGETVAMHGRLVETYRVSLPIFGGQTEWWSLAPDEEYIWRNLIRHMRAGDATQRAEAGALATDLRWVAAKAQLFGVHVCNEDLELIASPPATLLRDSLSRLGHLLGRDAPTWALRGMLMTRLWFESTLEPLVRTSVETFTHRWLKPLWPLPDQASGPFRQAIPVDTEVTSVAVSRSGSWLLIGGKDGWVTIWQWSSRLIHARVLHHSDGVTSVAISPDEKQFASSGPDGSINLWSMQSLTLMNTLSGHVGPVESVAYSGNGEWLASASWDRSVRLWNCRDGSARAVFTGHTDGVGKVSVSEEHGVTVSGGRDASVRIWDTQHGALVGSLTGHIGGVTALDITADGRYIVAGAWDGRLYVWDTCSKSLVFKVQAHESSVDAISVCSREAWIATGSPDRSLRLWSLISGEQIACLAAHSGGVSAVAFTEDGTSLYSGGREGVVKLWDPRTMKASESLTRWIEPADAIKFLSNGQQLIVGDRTGRLHVWDVSSGDLVATVAAHTSPIADISVNPRGGWIATGSWDGTIRIWDVENWALIATLVGHTDGVTTVAIAPNGAWLASGGWDNAVRIWKSGDWLQESVLVGHSNDVTCLAISSDGRFLVSGGWDGSLRTWDAHDAFRPVRAITPSRTGVSATCFSADDHLLFVGLANGELIILDVGNSAVVSQNQAHIGLVSCISAARDTDAIASAGPDGALRIWNVENGESQAFMTVAGAVSVCTWHPNKPLLAAAGASGVFLFEVL